MELKEYLKVIKENITLFFAVITVVVAGSFAYFALKPVAYSVSLALNITRSGSQRTTDYKYDDFYRLQADEKFAETAVEWLKNPRTVANIYAAAGIGVDNFSLRRLSKSLRPKKLSSQVVSVSFSARNANLAEKISSAVTEVISENTEVLNKNQNEDTWFKIIAQDPVIVRDKMSPLFILLASLAAGVFLSFWTVFVFHYLG